MRARSFLLLTALAFSALPSIAAQPPGPGCREVGTTPPGQQAKEVCTEVNYFHCSGDTKVASANYALDGSLPTWDKTPPAASVQSGAGCGWADSSALRSPQAGDSEHDGAWKGYVKGNLSSLTVRAHSISTGPGRAGGPQTFRATVFVNGQSMFGLASDGRANRADITLVPVVSSTQLSSLYEFTVTGLPFVTETGPGTMMREVIINLAASSEPMMAWVYDTTEVDSGVTFNPATNAAKVVAANP